MGGEHVSALQVLLIGLAVTLAVVVKGVAQRFSLPALVGHLLLGVLLRAADAQWGFMGPEIRTAFDLLASLGIVALLFEVGLTSHPRALAEKLPTASVLWVGNMLVAFAAGFGTVYWILGGDLLAALFTVGLWLIGHLSRDLHALGRQSELESVARVTDFLFVLMPDFEVFNKTLEAVHGLPIPSWEVGLAVVYSIGYTVCTLTLGAMIFSRRDFK